MSSNDTTELTSHRCPFFARFSKFINIMVIREIRYNVGSISFTLTEFQSCFLLNCPNLRGTNPNKRALLTKTVTSAGLAVRSGPWRVGGEQRNRNPLTKRKAGEESHTFSLAQA